MRSTQSLPDTALASTSVSKRVPSPIGELVLVAAGSRLTGVLWGDRPNRKECVAMSAPEHPVLVETAHQLAAYFAGERRIFDLPLSFGGTEFQRRVWNELLLIPFGETRTYGEIARRVGDVKAVRAVGAANGSNPIPIVAPCHRVIGASGALVGFGGGLDVKAQLLNFERGLIAFPFTLTGGIL